MAHPVAHCFSSSSMASIPSFKTPHPSRPSALRCLATSYFCFPRTSTTIADRPRFQHHKRVSIPPRLAAFPAVVLLGTGQLDELYCPPFKTLIKGSPASQRLAAFRGGFPARLALAVSATASPKGIVLPFCYVCTPAHLSLGHFLPCRLHLSSVPGPLGLDPSPSRYYCRRLLLAFIRGSTAGGAVRLSGTVRFELDTVGVREPSHKSPMEQSDESLIRGNPRLLDNAGGVAFQPQDAYIPPDAHAAR